MSTQTIDFELSTMIPDLLARHPKARRVLDRYGLHGCGGPTGPVESLGFFARTHGVEETRLMQELADAVSGDGPLESADDAPRLEDTIYRRFFIGGILTVMTAGATWGAWLLLKIAFAHKFTGVSIHEVNAHGHAQIYGWVALFIMGFAAQAFPRLWHTRLAWPGAAAAGFVMMLAGIVLRTVGMTAAGQGAWALDLAMAGGGLEIAASMIFVVQMLATYFLSEARMEPYIGFAIASMSFLVLQAGLDVWHTWRTMTAAGRDELLWQVATWQAPLRDLQIHGLAMLMIFGVCLRMLPALFDLPRVPDRRAWSALAVLVTAVVLEVGIFIAYRYTSLHWIAAFLMIPWIMLAAGAWMVAGKWRLWRGIPAASGQAQDRSAKFITGAYAWLAISLVMLLMLPVHQSLTRIAFSHAYYGAIRHAITVGFISLMIMGFAAKVVPTLNGIETRSLGAMWGPFILINIGCFLRVFLQSMTDANEVFFKFVGISGTLEVTALAWWGLSLVAIMRRGKREQEVRASRAEAPPEISPDHIVADVARWWPGTVDVLADHGFDAIRNRFLRATLARTVTIRRAAAMKGIDLVRLMADLSRVVEQSRGGCGAAAPAEVKVQLQVRARAAARA